MVHFETGLSNSTCSEGTLGLAKRWLENCMETHDECQAAFRDSQFVPTRLIEIKGSYDNEPQIRLRKGKALRFGATYATLSHCWGSYMPFKLTCANLKSCMTSMPIQDISQVFQDAIRLAFRWNIRFIWIDSLCKATSIS
jgi:hypothetical protein